MSTVVSKGNVAEFDAIVMLAARLGIAQLQFSEVFPHDDEARAMALTEGERACLDRPSLVRLGESLGVAVSFAPSRGARPERLNCFQPWEYAQLTAEGDVMPCCAVVGSREVPIMGNLYATSFEEIWRGARFRAFRQASARGTNPRCARCPYR